MGISNGRIGSNSFGLELGSKNVVGFLGDTPYGVLYPKGQPLWKKLVKSCALDIYIKGFTDGLGIDKTGTSGTEVGREAVVAQELIGDGSTYATWTNTQASALWDVEIITNSTTASNRYLFDCRINGGVGYLLYNSGGVLSVSSGVATSEELDNGNFKINVTNITLDFTVFVFFSSYLFGVPWTNNVLLFKLTNKSTGLTYQPDFASRQSDGKIPIIITDSNGNNVGTDVAQQFISPAIPTQDTKEVESVQDKEGYFIARALGKNLFNKDTALTDKYVDFNSGNIGGIVGWFASDYIYLKEEITNLYLNANGVGGGVIGLAWYDENKNYISGVSQAIDNYNPLTKPSNAKYIRFTGRESVVSKNAIQLELGSTPTTYEAWQGLYLDEAETTPYQDGTYIPVSNGKVHAYPVVQADYTGEIRKNFLESSKNASGVKWDKSTNINLERQNFTKNIGSIGVGANEFDKVTIYSNIKEVTDAFGNVFVRIPKFYIQKIDGTGNKVWNMSLTKIDGSYYLPNCFYDFTTQTELPYVDIGKHLGSVEGGKLQSKPDKFVTVNTNIVDFRTYAQANGAGYQLYDIHAVDIIQCLFFNEFATINSQNIMQGAVNMAYSESHTITVAENGTTRAIVSNDTAGNFVIGQSISIGTSRGSFSIFGSRKVTNISTYDASNMAIEFEGDPVDLTVGLVVYTAPWETGWSSPLQTGWIEENNGKYPCAYRGIESPWGDCYQWVDGINILDNQAWVCKDADEYASNAFMHPYEQLSYINSNADGYVEEMGHDPNLPFAEFPIRVGSSNYYGDYYYQSTGARVALMGGVWSVGSTGGLSFWYLNSSSSSTYIGIGTRLMRKAQVGETDDTVKDSITPADNYHVNDHNNVLTNADGTFKVLPYDTLANITQDQLFVSIDKQQIAWFNNELTPATDCYTKAEKLVGI